MANEKSDFVATKPVQAKLKELSFPCVVDQHGLVHPVRAQLYLEVSRQVAEDDREVLVSRG